MRHPGKQAHHESSVCPQDCEIAAPYDNQATEVMMASPRVVPANAGIHTPCPIDLNDGAEAFRNNQRQGLWAPAFAGATVWAWKHSFAISPPETREVCHQLPPSHSEGAGKPDVRCTRSAKRWLGHFA